MAIPWQEVKLWLDRNSIQYNISGDAAMQRIRIDLSKQDAFGMSDYSYQIYTHPEATMQNLGSFSDDEIMAAAGALRIAWP